MTTPGGYGTWAREYLAAGWAGVLPLPSGAKTPPPAGFTGYDGADPEPAQVLAWGWQRPGGNLALRLPDGVIALDVDDDPATGKHGGAAVARWESDLGPLPATWTNTRIWTPDWRTGVHGHRFYRVPEGERWKPDLGPGSHVEVVQHGHRYAVAWPSVHRSGDLYRWAAPDGRAATRLPRPDEFPELPDDWVAELVRPEASYASSVGGLERPGMATTLQRASADRLLATARAEWLGVRQGGGLHFATVRYLGTLARYLLADGIRPDELEAEVLARLDEHPDAPVSAWESLPGIVAWGLPEAVRSPWRFEEDWLAGFAPSVSAAVPAVATAAEAAELLAVCVRKGQPGTRAAVAARLSSLQLVPLPLRADAFVREAAAAWAAALAGDCSGEFALAALHRAFADHVGGTEQQYSQAILTALGTVLARYDHKAGAAA